MTNHEKLAFYTALIEYSLYEVIPEDLSDAAYAGFQMALPNLRNANRNSKSYKEMKARKEAALAAAAGAESSAEFSAEFTRNSPCKDKEKEKEKNNINSKEEEEEKGKDKDKPKDKDKTEVKEKGGAPADGFNERRNDALTRLSMIS